MIPVLVLIVLVEILVKIAFGKVLVVAVKLLALINPETNTLLAVIPVKLSEVLEILVVFILDMVKFVIFAFDVKIEELDIFIL